MFVKTANDQIVEYPYSIEQFRADNPTISFPAKISDETLVAYDVYPVGYEPAPEYDSATQKMVISSQPSLINGNWVLTKNIIDKTTDEITADTATKASQMRDLRNQRLAQTDWCAGTDVTMTTEMATYRQDLRDLPAQEGFPYSVIWPTKPA
jgi:hypothetical protein